MRQDTIAVQGFLLECFLYEGYVHTWGEAGGGGDLRVVEKLIS